MWLGLRTTGQMLDSLELLCHTECPSQGALASTQAQTPTQSQLSYLWDVEVGLAMFTCPHQPTFPGKVCGTGWTG